MLKYRTCHAPLPRPPMLSVSRYFTSVALASRNSKQLEIKPSVPADEDFPHQSDERTLQEEPEVSTGDQKMDTVTVEEIVILDSPKKTTVDEIIEISDSEDSVIEVETVSASKKKVNKPPPPISVPNTKSDIPPTSPKKTKIYEQHSQHFNSC
ncbi:hypothetical protein B566_EDAN009194 [Ephemera danica]|nr:hypothetical protein B566_EDAN009194 [Ephemera danica]